MATLWITFRIDSRTVSGRDYDERYQALVDAINAHADDAWDEPTSFWLFSTRSTRAQVAATVKAALSRTYDVALIGSMDTLGATLVGTAEKESALRRLIGNLDAA